MANRIPLIVDSGDLRIKELPASDNLDVGNSEIVNSGNITMVANSVASVFTTTMYYSNLGVLNGNTTVNISSHNYFIGFANANLTFTFSSAHSGNVSDTFLLRLVDGGSYTITWPETVRWPSGSAPTLSTSNSDLFVFITDNNGSDWRAAYQLDYV